MDVFLPKPPKHLPPGTSSQNTTKDFNSLRCPTPEKRNHQGKVVMHTGVLVMESFLATNFYPEVRTPSDGKKTYEITKEKRTHCFQKWLFGISTGQRGVVCWALVEGVPG